MPDCPRGKGWGDKTKKHQAMSLCLYLMLMFFLHALFAASVDQSGRESVFKLAFFCFSIYPTFDNHYNNKKKLMRKEEAMIEIQRRRSENPTDDDDHE